MKVTTAITLTAAMAVSAATYAQSMGGPMMGRGGMMGNISPRHPYVVRYGLPEAYRNLSNPLQVNEVNIRAGKQQYEVSCAVCHGSSTRGDGPAASQLNPPPTDLQFAVRTRIASDGFLYWSIAEGGAPIGSAMPAFNISLKADDIWKIILYLRSNYPSD